MKPTKCCFQCGEGTETFQIWHLGSGSWSVGQRSIYVRIDILLCKVSQELVFLQWGEFILSKAFRMWTLPKEAISICVHYNKRKEPSNYICKQHQPRITRNFPANTSLSSWDRKVGGFKVAFSRSPFFPTFCSAKVEQLIPRILRSKCL